MPKEMFLQTEDNIKIGLNLYKTNHKSVVIICPGWFMTKDCNSFNMLSEQLSKTFDVITMDFRGHGKSGGLYTFMSKEIFDLKSVVNYAKSIYDKVFLLGFSLGGGLVLIHAANEHNVDKVIAVSAPADFYKIENHMWHPSAWIPTIFKKFEPKRWLTIRPGWIFYKKIKPEEIVTKIDCPVCFAAGEKDPTIYPWHTKMLFDKAGCKKEFVLFENCHHAEDLFMENPDKFLSMCNEWFNS